jgi:hypothetical protein
MLSEPAPARWLSLAALLFTAVLATIVIGILPPFWDTNDDVGMAMILDGNGLAAYPSPGIIYSNILYGYALAMLPQLGDISRYSLTSISLNILAIFLICRASCLLSRNYVLALSITLLISLVPLTFPQFTILAGMLGIAGVLHIAVYLGRGQRLDLLIAGFALFIGYLIRSHELYLVLLTSSVVLPWKDMRGNRQLKMLAATLVGLGIAAALADWRYYQIPEWQAFREVNSLRAAFTDFGVATYFLERLDLLKDTGYSPNDVALLREWFLVDAQMVNPERLSALLSRVDPYAFVDFNFSKGASFAGFFEPPLLYALIPAVAAGILAKNRIRIALAWLVLIVAIVGLSLIGRPPPTRVLYAPMTLLLCLGALQLAPALWQWVLIGSIGLAVVPVIEHLKERHNIYATRYSIARTDLATLDPSNLYVVWGSALDYAAMYPPLGSMREARRFHWYALGAGSLAPFAMSQWKETPSGLPARLVNGEPVPIFASRDQIGYLSIYCKERHSRESRVLSVQNLMAGTVFTVTCR